MQSQNIRANTVTYSAAISACEKGWQWQQALRLLGDMQIKNIWADTVSYSAAISACEKGWQWQQALRLLGDMQIQNGKHPDPQRPSRAEVLYL